MCQSPLNLEEDITQCTETPIMAAIAAYMYKLSKR